MQAVVIYDSQFGNTKQIAQAIACAIGEHGSVEMLPASEAGGSGSPLVVEGDLRLGQRAVDHRGDFLAGRLDARL